MGLSSSKSRKFRIFGKHLPLEDKSPLLNFPQKGRPISPLAWGRQFQASNLMPNFSDVS